MHRVAIRRGKEIIDQLDGGKSVTVLRREENLEEAKLDGVLTASVQPSGLQIDDILEVATTITRLDPSFQNQDEIATGYLLASAIGRLHIRADWPAARAFRWRTLPGLPAARPFDAGPTKGMVIEADRVEPLQLPEGAPNRYYQVGSFEVTEFSSYGAISALLFPLFSKTAKLEPNTDLDAAISKIKSENASAAARTLAALRLVQEKVRYIYVGIGQGGYVPADANLTWNRRFGDCKGKTALLIAILERLGVSAEAALVQTVSGEGLEARLPLVQSFDHVIVRVDLDGKTRWIDPTRFGDLSLEPNPGPGYFWALPLRAKGAELERLPDTPQTQPSIETFLTMDAREGISLPVKLEARTIIRGDEAVTLNVTFDSLNPSQRNESLREYWKNTREWEKIETVNFTFDPLKRQAELNAKGLVKITTYAGEKEGKQFILAGGDVAWTSKLEREDGPNANTPFKIGHPFFISSTQSITLPYNGFGFSIRAEAIDQTLGPWQFQRTSSMTDATATVKVTTRSLSGELAAAEAKSVSGQFTALSKKRVSIQIAANLPATPAEFATPKNANLTDEDALLDRAYQYSLFQEYEEALKDYDAILATNPNSVWALANRAILYTNLYKSEKAVEDTTKALALDPNNWVANNAAGKVAFLRKDYTRAIEYFSKSYVAYPTDTYSLQARASSYVDIKDFPKAIADYEALNKSASKNPFFLTNHARALVLNGQVDQAFALMDAFVEESKGDSVEYEHAIMARVSVALAGKLGARALADANALLAKDRNSVPLLTYRCQVQATLEENLHAALADCQKALKLDPNYDEALILRGTVYLKLKMPKLAQADFQSALRLASESATARSGLGIAKIAQGKVDGEQDMITARALNPFIEEYWTSLGVKFTPEGQSPTP